MTLLTTFPQALARAAAEFGDETALCFSAATPQKLSYRELALNAGLAALALKKAGAAPGQFIPVCLPRGLEAVVWILGVIQAGATAVPLAPDIPVSRARYICEDTRARFAVVHPDTAPLVQGIRTFTIPLAGTDFWKPHRDGIPPVQETGQDLPCPDDPIIAFYTSGTTGQPKGVVLSHTNVLSFAQGHRNLAGIRRQTRVAACSTISFDAFVMDVLAPLIAGARVYILDEATRMSLVGLHRYFMRQKIEVVFLTTRLGEAYMAGFDNPHLSCLLTGGEAMQRFVPRSFRLFNLYGPTETTAYVAGCPIERPMADFPLGRAFSHMRVMVMDEAGQACPPGRMGEIWISGPQVSRGYLNRPLETAAVFVPNPLYDPETDGNAYAMAYRTGDLGLTDQDGQLFFRGRADHQVKIRGFRIEPVEIEAAMLRHPDVAKACVTVGRDPNSDPFLTAYFVRSPGAAGKGEIPLKAHLKEILPVQMVPRHVAELRDFPLNANGKVDLAGLPVQGWTGPDSGQR